MLKSNFAQQNIDPQEVVKLVKSLKRRGFLLLSIFIVGGMIVGLFMGIIPTINNIINQQKQLATEQEHTVTLENKKKQVQMIENDKDFANAALVDEVLFSDNPFIPMMYSLDKVRQDNQIPSFVRQELSPGLVATPSAEFANLRRSQQSNANRLASKKDAEGFTIFLEVGGSYLSLVKFLHQLENHAPFNSVAYSEIANSLNGNASAKFEILSQYYPPQMKASLLTKIPSLDDKDKKTLQDLEKVNRVDLSQLSQADFINYKRINPFAQASGSGQLE